MTRAGVSTQSKDKMCLIKEADSAKGLTSFNKWRFVLSRSGSARLSVESDPQSRDTAVRKRVLDFSLDFLVRSYIALKELVQAVLCFSEILDFCALKRC